MAKIEYVFKSFKEPILDDNGKPELDKKGNVVYQNVTHLGYIDKDKWHEAPPAYVYKGPEGKDAPINVAKPQLVSGKYPGCKCLDCKAKVNVFALVLHGEVRVLCVQCLSEIAGRWLSSIHK